MSKADFSLEACIKEVEWMVETLHKNPFEELGRSIVRGEQDIFFNKTMIEAWKQYITDQNMSWNE